MSEFIDNSKHVSVNCHSFLLAVVVSAPTLGWFWLMEVKPSKSLQAFREFFHTPLSTTVEVSLITYPLCYLIIAHAIIDAVNVHTIAAMT